MNRRIPSLLAPFSPAVLVLPLTPSTIAAEPPGNLPSYHFSPGGVSAASLTMKGSGRAVVVNGVEGPFFDELLTKMGEQSFTCVRVKNPSCFSAP